MHEAFVSSSRSPAVHSGCRHGYFPSAAGQPTAPSQSRIRVTSSNCFRPCYLWIAQSSDVAAAHVGSSHTRASLASLSHQHAS